jgi:hypothetical protein
VTASFVPPMSSISLCAVPPAPSCIAIAVSRQK